MASFNKVILAGNLTRPPELRYTPKGTPITRIGLAVNRRWTGEDGQQREEVTYVDIDAFGKQAETLGKSLQKGSALLLEGRLRLDSWEDKQTGEKKSKLGVVLETFTFLDPPPSRQNRPEDAPPAQSYRSQAPAPAPQAAPQSGQAPSWRRNPRAPKSSEAGPD